MKKYKSFLALYLMLVIILTGCGGHAQSLDLAICGSYAVPGMMCSDLKGGSFQYSIIESDSQGRILFSYTTSSIITQKEETAIIVCQAIDSDYVYFYEDQCYLLGEVTDEDIEKLKAHNDWGEELDFKKMARRTIAISFDLFLITDSNLYYNDILSAISDEFQIPESDIKVVCFLDKSPSGQELNWVEIQKENSTQKYYMIINTDYELWYVEVDEDDTDLSTVVTFKQDSGWDYE